MRIKLILASLMALLFCSTYAQAQQNVDQPEQRGMMEVGNKICPVTGAKIGSMGSAVQYEYKGKIYNFCCQGCVQAFKKDPEKYIRIIQTELENTTE